MGGRGKRHSDGLILRAPVTIGSSISRWMLVNISHRNPHSLTFLKLFSSRCNVEWAGTLSVLSYSIISNDPSPKFFFYSRGLLAGTPVLPFGIQLAQQTWPSKLRFFHFPRSISWLWGEVFRGYLLGGASTQKEKAITLDLFKRNLHFLGYPLLIRGGSLCPLLRQRRRQRCNVPSWSLVFRFLPFYAIFQSQISKRSGFHE